MWDKAASKFKHTIHIVDHAWFKFRFQIGLTSLVGEACVLDVPDEKKDNKDYLITIEDVKKWEEIHGKLHEDCMVFVRSGQVH